MSGGSYGSGTGGGQYQGGQYGYGANRVQPQSATGGYPQQYGYQGQRSNVNPWSGYTPQQAYPGNPLQNFLNLYQYPPFNRAWFTNNPQGTTPPVTPPPVTPPPVTPPPVTPPPVTPPPVTPPPVTPTTTTPRAPAQPPPPVIGEHYNYDPDERTLGGIYPVTDPRSPFYNPSYRAPAPFTPAPGYMPQQSLDLANRFQPLDSSVTPQAGESYLQFAQRAGFPVGSYGAALTMSNPSATPDQWMSTLQKWY